MRYYPLFLDIKNRPCLVIGGGKIATDKIRGLLTAGAKITVISKTISRQIKRYTRRIVWEERAFDLADISEKYRLVFGATGDSALNQQISEICLQKQILVNCVDDPDHCEFIVPAMLRRGPITVAVSTSGASPLLARDLKQTLKTQIGPVYTQLGRYLKQKRPWVHAKIETEEERKQFWERFFMGNPVTLLKSGGIDRLEGHLMACFSEKSLG